jgi:hypothetical protein
VSEPSVIVEISMYPTKNAYLEAVDEFLAALSRVPDIEGRRPNGS